VSLPELTVVQLSDTEQQPVCVRNFAIDSAFHDDGVVGSTVEELHIQARAVFSLEFYRLKRLHIHWRKTATSDFPVERILKQSQFTHIAISVPHWGFVNSLIRLLVEQKPLLLLYLRLLPRLTWAPHLPASNSPQLQILAL
jgi:hypothetical protein